MRSAPNEIEAWLSACPAEHTNYAKHWLLALCDATNSTQSQSVVQLTFKNQQDINHHVSPRALCAAQQPQGSSYFSKLKMLNL